MKLIRTFICQRCYIGGGIKIPVNVRKSCIPFKNERAAKGSICVRKAGIGKSILDNKVLFIVEICDRAYGVPDFDKFWG